MSTIIMSACWPLQGMSPAQKAVLISLADNANDEGACWPSVARIAERTCLTERTVRYALRWLEESKILTAHMRSGRSTWYTISPFSYYPGISCPPATDAPQPRQEMPLPPAPVAPHPGNKCPQNRKGTINEPSGSFASTPDDSKTVTVDQIVELFNELLPELPRVVLVNKDRKSKVQARLAESPVHQDLDFWRDFFGMVRSSDWLMGKVAGRDGKGFRCNFDWLIAPTNFVKVVEGNYNA